MFRDLIPEIEDEAHTFTNVAEMNALIEHIKDRKVVMFGEASHGTHEYYHWRSLITQELIQNHGFRFVAVEGDWPPCQELNHFLQGKRAGSVYDTLSSFERWPTWMWANQEVAEFAKWLHDYNRLFKDKVSFHGLDVYSLFESIAAVTRQAAKASPDLADFLAKKYSCFEPYGGDEEKYIRQVARFTDTCEQEVLEALQRLLQERLQSSSEVLFDMTQNARIIKNAETYYRAMIFAEDSSWNVRDRHMMETLEILLGHHGPDAKGIVWAHNTHIGDYKATSMVRQGNINIGGLAREILGEDKVALVGFGSYQGSVIASNAWAGPVRVLKVPPGTPGSYEDLFHHVAEEMNASQFYFLFDHEDRSKNWTQRRGHRAIGVVYEPDFEYGNYVSTEIAKRYDAFVFFEKTRALSPLDNFAQPKDLPETYPFGL